MKKRIAAVAGVLAFALAGQNVFAKTLEDVLKEKGVITEEDYKEITKSKPFDYTLGKGFTFTSPNEKFQLTLGGRMQFRYTYTDKDPRYSSTTGLITNDDSSLWNAQRIRLIAQGYAYTKDLTYKLEIDPRALASSPSNGGLLDAYMNYKLIDEVQVRLGQYKTPFGRQELTSDGALQFVDRSPVINALKHGYDIGAMLNGKVAGGLAYYNLGVFGGAGQTTGRSTNDNAFFARVAVNPLGDMPYDEPDFDKTEKPLLSIGANYFFNTLKKTGGATPALETTVPNYASSSGWLGKGFNKVVSGVNVFGGNAANTTTKFDIDTYGADLAFKWMGFSLAGEYLLGQAESQTTRKLLRAQGYYVQAGYMIIPKTLEVAFRYSYLDPDRDKVNDTITEQIGAISYYFNKHNLKLQADIGNTHDQSGYGVTQTGSKPYDDMQYRVQAQIIF
jgi:phosphate-selective porin OprO and OprP